MSRRQFLAGSAALAGAATTLAACGGSSDDTSTNPTTTAGKSSGNQAPAGPPAYVPYTGVKPDIAAGPGSIPAGFYHYPANPPTFVTGPVGSGDTINLMLEANTAIATPRDRNQWWRAMDKSLNVQLQFNTTPAVNYLQKFQVSIAGGELGDLTQINMVQNMPQVLEKYFTDLTPHLSGDAIKKYPGLASLPTSAWSIPTLNGKLWGIPQPRSAVGVSMNYRGDLFQQHGVAAADITSGQDFLNVCKELTDMKNTKYALGELPNTWILNAVLEMMEAPNGWSVDGSGKFTNVYESDQMKDALGVVQKMWSAGYIHPDSFNATSYTSWWYGGITAIYLQSVVWWPGQAAKHPDWKVGVIVPPKWAGGGSAKKALGLPGYPDFIALKQADDSKTEELLRVCDYLAAPFGTAEYLEVNYGVKDHDYVLQGTDPVGNDTGTAETLPYSYVGTQEFVNVYVPGEPDLVKAQHDYIAKVLPDGIGNPTWGLYSETSLSKGPAAAKPVSDAQAQIIQGRKSISDWDEVVATWRKAAGNQMRSEYETAYAANH